MDYSKEFVRNRIFSTADDVCKFLQSKVNVTIIAITSNDKFYTVFYC